MGHIFLIFSLEIMAAKQTIIVVGGNGYVGSRMCEQAILSGYNVVSISRSGTRPSWLKTTDWSQQVQYAQGDALEMDSMRPHFANDDGNVRAVISCVGCFSIWNSVMKKINGDTNINACAQAKENKIEKFVFVSAWRPEHLLSKWNPCSYIFVPGYYDGKKRTEEKAEEVYGDDAVCFRAGMVIGRRWASETSSIDLTWFGKAFRMLFVPTVGVDDLAKAALRFVKSEKQNTQSHIVENDDIANFFV